MVRSLIEVSGRHIASILTIADVDIYTDMEAQLAVSD